jgi:hypothetical protein
VPVLAALIGVLVLVGLDITGGGVWFGGVLAVVVCFWAC